VIERYDRRETEGLPIRIHQEDLCQALGIHPGRKYQADGGPTPGDIVGLMRRAMPASAANGAVRRFADALIWNWIIAGTDAHAKNYSLLLSGQQVRLAPLYDIASALPYDTHEKKLEFAMKIGGDYKVFTYRGTWPKAAIEFGVDPEALVARAAELAERAPAAFAAAAADPAVAAMESDMPARLVEMVGERATRCRRALG
jgi:serine/threonine-protein kinase HipA